MYSAMNSPSSKEVNLILLNIVIPTLNEAKAIGRVIDEVIGAGVPRENILVVDGGSNDGTIDEVKSRNVKVVMQKGKGKADAIKTAIEHVSKPYVLVMDGDYTYPAKHIPELYMKALEGYELVIGARKKFEKGAQNILYRIGNKLLTKFFNLLFGTRLSDVLSGMYIVKTEKLREILFETKNFSIESEIVAHIAATSGKIAETPVEYRKRIGKKKLGVRHGLRIAVDMIRLAWRYNPTFFIFALGSLLLIPGLILGGWVAYHYFFTGIKYYVKGAIAVVVTLIGIQSMLMAVLALYMNRVELRLRRMIENLKETIQAQNGVKQ